MERDILLMVKPDINNIVEFGKWWDSLESQLQDLETIAVKAGLDPVYSRRSWSSFEEDEQEKLYKAFEAM